MAYRLVDWLAYRAERPSVVGMVKDVENCPGQMGPSLESALYSSELSSIKLAVVVVVVVVVAAAAVVVAATAAIMRLPLPQILLLPLVLSMLSTM